VTRLLCFIILLLPVSAPAEVMYLTDVLEVAVRSGKGLEYEIVAIAKSNEEAKIISTDGEYAKIRLANGIEGWVLSRYLTLEPPKSVAIATLNDEIESLKGKNKQIEDNLRALVEEKNALDNANKTRELQAQGLIKEYAALKDSCADHVKLQEDHERLKKDCITHQREVSRLTLDNQALREKAKLFWFIAGSSAVLAGFVIGMLLQGLRTRRKRELSF